MGKAKLVGCGGRMAVALALAVVCAPAAAQVREDGRQVAMMNAERCAREVRDYFEAMRFIRDAAGQKIGDRVAAGMVSEEAITRTLESQGACAAAQTLRERARQTRS
jgi:hypothetical protein